MDFFFSGFLRKPEKDIFLKAEILIIAKSICIFHRRWIELHPFHQESDKK